MRLIISKTVIAISFMATFLPQMASATASPNFSCSSNLVVSLENGYNASCDGDFSFTDGALQNDTSISLTAGGLLNIGTNASLNAPFINWSSKDIFLGGILNAPNGKIIISSTNSTIIASGAQTNVVGNSIIQTAPKAIVDWNAFNIRSAISGSDITTFGGDSIDAGKGSKSQPIELGVGSVFNYEIGSGIRTQNYEPVQGGTLVLKNANGGILPAGAISNADSNFPTVLDISSALMVSNVPEPSSYLMLLLGFASIGFARRSKG